MTRLSRASLTVAVAFVLGACSAWPHSPDSGHRDGGHAAGLARYADQKIVWTPCPDARGTAGSGPGGLGTGGTGTRGTGRAGSGTAGSDLRGIECGTVTVPLDHAEPGGEALEVAVYRVPARGGERTGTVVLLPEGPGESGADLLRPDLFAFRELGLTNDLVSFDPRGTGSTLPVRCGRDTDRAARESLDATPDSPAEEMALLDAWERYATSCHAASGDALAVLGTRDVVRDLDILRRAIGEKHLNLYGVSYGSLVAGEYVRLFPDRVSRAVLDAPRTPAALVDEAGLEEMVAGAERTLDEALLTCFENPFLACPLGASPSEARARVEHLLEQLDARPRLASGELGTVADPARFGTVADPARFGTVADPAHDDAALLTRERVVGALWRAMGQGPDGWRPAVRALARASAGDWRELSTEVAADADRTPHAAAAVRCTDRGPLDVDVADLRRRAAEHGERYPVFGETAAWWPVECAGWPVGPTLDVKSRPSGAAPIPAVLLVASLGDPLTPTGFAAAAAEHVGQARVLTYSGTEHLAYVSSPCVRYVVNDFLTRGVLPHTLSCDGVPLRSGRSPGPCGPTCGTLPIAARVDDALRNAATPSGAPA